MFARVVCAAILFAELVDAANFTVGYLTADRTETFVHKKQGRIISGAMTLAIKRINADPQLLRGHRLHFVWADTRADTLTSTNELTKQWRDGAIAFFGPEDSCDVEARVAAAWNLPMLSYKCADDRLSDKRLYPTFARSFPPASQVTRSILALLRHFRWHRFSIVAGSSAKWQAIADRLVQLATAANFSLNGRFTFAEPYVPQTGDNPFPDIVTASYVDTRVYMFLGECDGMVELMRSMAERGLLTSDEYVIIHVDFDTYTNNDPLKYFKGTHSPANDRGRYEPSRSLIVIVSSPPTNPRYARFHALVNRFNEERPFRFPNPFGKPKKISVYAAYLYDAVYLYARALDEVIRQFGIDASTDGLKIFNRIRSRQYQSIQGFQGYIDENGDADGNFTVLARTPLISTYGTYSMLPVGHFQIRNGFQAFTQLVEKQFDWSEKGPPRDEPACGYRQEKCIVPPNYTVEIVCGVIGGIALTTAIVLTLMYRNWRYEQEIAGLSWQIHFADLESMSAHRNCLYDSKLTIGSQASGDSRMSWIQVFTKAAMYKGTVVALKRYTARTVDITRALKKEMKTMRDLRHDNVNAFIGACVGPQDFIAVTEYCSKGSLQDILENDDLNLDTMFMSSLVMDLVKGMLFLHESDLRTHGNLKSSNCVVNSRWSLQVTDFGLCEIRRTAIADQSDHAKYRDLLWTAPELLRSTCRQRRGTQKSDVFSFGIILYEVVSRSSPYGNTRLSPKEIIAEVMSADEVPAFRPDVGQLECQDYLKECMRECWAEMPENRPDFRTVRSRLKAMRKGMKSNIIDNMLAMMEKYQKHLEDLVSERTEQLEDEQKKTEGLLHRMLPASVAQPLLRGNPVVPEAFEAVTIYFSDICGFTALSADSSPMQVVDLLNDLYTLFDSIISGYDVYKVETIGDAYMVVSGLPVRNGHHHAGHVASMSLHLLAAMRTFRIRHRPGDVLKLRIGIHSGPCVAGVVGLTMPRYCLFGDTVNTSSRMEANGEALKIHVSEQSKTVLDILGGYVLEPRGYVTMKGKGDVFTYWLVGERTATLPSAGGGSHDTSDVTSVSVSAPSGHSAHTRIDNRPQGSFLDLMRKSRVAAPLRPAPAFSTPPHPPADPPAPQHLGVVRNVETDKLIGCDVTPTTNQQRRWGGFARRSSSTSTSVSWAKINEFVPPTITMDEAGEEETCRVDNDCRVAERVANGDSDIAQCSTRYPAKRHSMRRVLT